MITVDRVLISTQVVRFGLMMVTVTRPRRTCGEIVRPAAMYVPKVRHVTVATDFTTVFIVRWRNRSSISILHLQSHEFDLRFRLGKPLHPETRKLQYVCCKLSNMLDSSWLSGFLSTT